MYKYLMSVMLVLFLFCQYKGKKENVPSSKEKITAKEQVDVSLTSGKLFRIENFPSAYVKPRNVDIWLPDTYSKDKKYAVLYMHDGQMLFDATKTWNQQEWKVDEWASTLMNEQKVVDFIVVAIWNIPEIRHADYFPRKPFLSLDTRVQDSLFTEAKKNNSSLQVNALNADKYLKFITQELKRYMDANYAVKTDMKNTVMAGSSMGGLISMYAVCEYPTIFGGAACLSTHWPGVFPNDYNPVPNAFFEYMKNKIPSPESHKFYFDFGTETLDAYYGIYETKVNTIFKEKGYTEQNFQNLKFEGADHSENSWNKRLDKPLVFLLTNE